jgi:hypothetical protein
MAGFGDDVWSERRGRGFRRRSRQSRGPSVLAILLAGLAAFALVRLTTAANRPNLSTAQKVAVGALIVLVGGVLLSLRRSAQRYRWSA